MVPVTTIGTPASHRPLPSHTREQALYRGRNLHGEEATRLWCLICRAVLREQIARQSTRPVRSGCIAWSLTRCYPSRSCPPRSRWPLPTHTPTVPPRQARAGKRGMASRAVTPVARPTCQEEHQGGGCETQCEGGEACAHRIAAAHRPACTASISAPKPARERRLGFCGGRERSSRGLVGRGGAG